MPNWASCAIETKDERILARFRKVAALGDEGELFEEFFPMPPELKTIQRGGRMIGDEYVTAWRGVGDAAVAVTQEEQDALFEQYGAADWYDYSVNEYGTKWDTSISGVTMLPDGMGRINFDTAWSPPERFVVRLSEMYPEADITLSYCEQGMGFWGLSTYRNGEAVVEWSAEGSIYKRDLPEDAWDTMDPEDMLLPEVRKFLSEHDLGTGG